jgi:Tectonin domain
MIKFLNVPKQQLTQIAVGGDHVWGIDDGSNLYQFIPAIITPKDPKSKKYTDGTWKAFPTPPVPVPPFNVGVFGSYNSVAVAPDGTAWAILVVTQGAFVGPTGIAGTLLCTQHTAGGSFQPVAQTDPVGTFFNPVIAISAASVGGMWALQGSTGLPTAPFVWSGIAGSPGGNPKGWAPVEGGGNLFQISAAPDFSVFGLDDTGHAYTYSGFKSGNAFTKIPGPFLSSISNGGIGHVWALGPSNDIHQFDATTETWTTLPKVEKLMQISASGSSVWGINTANEVYRYDKPEFHEQNGKLLQIAVSGDIVWGVNSKNQVWVYDPAVS